VDRQFGDVWHLLQTQESPAKKCATRPEKAAHYTQRFAVLQGRKEVIEKVSIPYL
jgi:hypothetical protein